MMLWLAGCTAPSCHISLTYLLSKISSSLALPALTLSVRVLETTNENKVFVCIRPITRGENKSVYRTLVNPKVPSLGIFTVKVN